MKSITERHRLILNKLQDTGHVNVQQLSTQLKVSEVTIRKDLKLLEDKGLLFRTHGGASKTNPYTSDKPVSEKEKLNAEEKTMIAKVAAAMIGNNDSIIIASGTTMVALARSINPQKHLTVITSALNVAMELSTHQNVDVLQLGGQLRQNSSSVMGPYAEQILQDVSCSILFLGVDGIDLEMGLTTTSLMEARLNQKMIDAAQITIVLADSSKFGKRGLGKICALDQIQHIITDKGIAPALVKILEDRGINVTIV
ncbi:DeoR/GlpR family DNA-binding transcription regulator [Mucilaginibacter pocheonensis]|uniref:DeoR family transcriptional regulator of aga operon n=1 Tax=Mucilaginibacter pocheonensis TaxID=398050 RepID=A0ABU1TF91_9SPHI|nr:DeoR/GlpR family DNA-binding transcription regulator [Mucilaginibacter pocheonensis]MDR6944027.1 DeoR family transcriptional regulator of aga operon [Mucilaginibacter pocheonensis]